MVRYKLSEMPGKLDHATVVAFKVGLWPDHCEINDNIVETGFFYCKKMFPFSSLTNVILHCFYFYFFFKINLM